MKLFELIEQFETYCSPKYAMEGDFCGLQIGKKDSEVKRILFTLDIRPEVVKEAIEQQIDLIIAKHAPIFRPIQSITDASAQDRMYLDLIKHEINVYVAHTNIDIVPDGLNDWFCEALDLQVLDYLKATHYEKVKKLVFYIPQSHAENMRQLLGDAKAGIQGNYHHMSFSSEGLGRFEPNELAKPTIGQANQVQSVLEERVEVLIQEKYLSQVLKVLKENHPYEEVAFDLYDLAKESAAITSYGIGRIGKLAKPESLEQFCQRVKAAFNLSDLRVIKPNDMSWQQNIQTVAICGGSGEKFYREALQKQADVFITGDVYYHTAHDLQANRLITLDPGHHIEVLFVQKVMEKFVDWKNQYQWDVELIPSKVNTNPFITI